ncbi:MAG: UDP-N-acetylenolpyruvoylglucosamine reductase [Nitrospirae bacterium GWF2_44_13]|nr:MAG: UDP-N-acetylenolpyruvoylglucosamine reductase [Nitrospirae bacterium GWF2_44_13]OGW32896.1 MAG: UDP-N-acetylenolpyruvoylglucosamine reductase [Nitrospirae bacterium GWD2_44_7]OGW66256.1 MAG: UDP-N-acetylenolpyruvoylglucosamine reductase [Nitrospirae bacterium RIFOXYA2_FULL_44_9]OGW71557.1 MAG: UDP-N-acetylenolpyruvoylglucosamine reductase [Nitrospirae bacterium RIFOXYC2_FULL_44_7]
MISQESFSGEVKFMEPMKAHTYLQIGGEADVFACPQDTVSLENILAALNEERIPFVTVGGGTNILVKDGGIYGVVISLKNFRRSDIAKEEKDMVMFFAESGTPLQKLVSFSKENGYSGIEGLAGIPGSVGGAIAGNAGAFGYSIKNMLVSVRMTNPDKGIYEMSASELGLEYRASKLPEDTVILSANMRLRKDVKEDVAKRINSFLKRKRETQPLSEMSAGCVFKNPEGASAGRLIDEAGCKGMRIGNAEVSRMHANFFINKGNAKASDFLKLMDEVKKKVMKVFGTELEPEIRIMGRNVN